MDTFGLAREIFGFIYVLLIPGFVATWVFFPKKNEISWIERIALTMGLSIGLSTIPLMILNYFGVLVNEVNVFLIILCVIVFCAVIAGIRIKNR